MKGAKPMAGIESGPGEIRYPVPVREGYRTEIVLTPLEGAENPQETLPMHQGELPPPTIQEQLFDVVATHRLTIMRLPVADMQTLDQNQVDTPTQELDLTELEEALRPLIDTVFEKMDKREVFVKANQALALSLGAGPDLDEMVKLASRRLITVMERLKAEADEEKAAF